MVKELREYNRGCARCKEEGHIARNYNGPERRECFRCRKIGHIIAQCKQAADLGHESQTQSSQTREGNETYQENRNADEDSSASSQSRLKEV